MYTILGRICLQEKGDAGKDKLHFLRHHID